MILYSDPKEVEAHALGAIKKYGFAPEHSYTCFSNSAEEGMKPVYIATEEGYGAFGYAPDSKDEDEWELSGEPLAPQEARAGIIAEWVKHAFKHGAAKMHLELSDETRQELLKLLPDTLKASRISERLIWPILQMKDYDPELKGAKMKPIRNAKNRFLKEHDFAVVDPNTVSSTLLHGIVDRWKKDRIATHTAYAAEYHNLIDGKFAGTDGARALIVDGEPHAISAGWPIPNSDGYYHSLALHTYAHWGLGEMLMAASLDYIKNAGYAFANLGGSDEPLLLFKKKFGPVSTYSTCYFTVKPA